MEVHHHFEIFLLENRYTKKEEPPNCEAVLLADYNSRDGAGNYVLTFVDGLVLPHHT